MHAARMPALAGLIVGAMAGGALAEDKTLALDSVSSFEVQKVFAARSGSNEWVKLDIEGLMPAGPTIIAGGSGEVRFPANAAGGCLYDLRFQMDSDVTFHDYGVDLCAADAYTLHDMFE